MGDSGGVFPRRGISRKARRTERPRAAAPRKGEIDVLISQALVSAVVGAFAGYLTNDLALKLMFDGLPLGKKGISPLITRSKKKLGDSLGGIVRDRLMNAPEEGQESPLAQKLSGDAFAEEMQVCMDDLLANILPNILGNIHVSEIDGYEETAAGFRKLLEEYVERYLPGILTELTDGLPLSAFLTETQRKTILSRLLEIIAGELDSGLLEERLAALIHDSETRCLADILGENETKQISGKLCRSCMEELVEGVFSSPKEFQTVLRKADLEGVIFTALNSAANEPLARLLGSDSLEEFVQQNRPALRTLIASEPFERVLNSLAEQIIAALRDLHIPLYNLFPVNEQNKLSEFFSQKLPDLMPYLSDYLHRKQEEIDDLIEKEVDAVISEETSEWFWANELRSLLRDKIIEKIRQLDIIHAIEVYADNLLQSEDMEAACRDMMAEFLRSTSIADLAEKFLTAEMLSGLLQRLCSAFLDDIPEELYRKLGEVRLARLLDERTLRVLAKKLAFRAVPAFSDWLFNSSAHREILINKSTQLMTKEADRLLHTEVGELLKDFDPFSLHLGTKARAWLERENEEILAQLRPSVDRIVEGKDCLTLLSGSMDTLARKLSAAAGRYVTASADKLGKIDLSKRLRRLSHTVSSTKIAGFCQRLLPSAVQRWTDIRQFVSNRIQGMDNKWLGDCMRQLFGKHLRPLCYLGAGIGAVIAFSWECLPFNAVPLWPLTTASCLQLLPRAAAYAVIGVLTNWLAFFGLFRPYTPRKWLPVLSFIPRRTAMVAEGIGTAVQDYLLNASAIQDELHNSKEKLHADFAAQLTANDCDLLYQWLKGHHRELLEKATPFLQKILRQRGGEVASVFCGLAGKIPLNDIADSSIYRDAGGKLTSWLLAHQSSFLPLEKAQEIRPSLYELRLITEDAAHTRMDTETRKFLDRFCAENLNFDSVRTLSEVYEPAYQKWRVKPLRECLPSFRPGQDQQVAEQLSEWLVTQLFSQKTSDFVCVQLDKILQKEFSPDMTLGSCMNGRLREWLDGNIDRITAFLLNKVLLKPLQDSEQDIIDSLLLQLRQSVGRIQRVIIDADELATSAVSRILRHGLPDFFSQEAQDIAELVRNLLTSEFYPVSIAKLQFNVQQFDLKPLIQCTLSDYTLRQRAQDAVTPLVRLIMNEVLDQKTGTLADAVHISSLTEACDRFRPQLILFSESLRMEVSGSERFLTAASDYADTILSRYIFARPAGELLAFCPLPELEPIVRNLTTFILSQAAVRSFLQTFVERLYNNYASESILHFLDVEELKMSVERLMQDRILRDDFIREQCDCVLRTLITEHFRFIAPETREWAASACVEAVLNTVNTHIEELLRVVDIRQLTEQVIRGMDGRSIHQMFLDFAAPYFHQMIALGTIGAIYFLPGMPASCCYIGLSCFLLALFRPKPLQNPAPSKDE